MAGPVPTIPTSPASRDALGGGDRAGFEQQLLEPLRLARLGHEFDGAQRTRMARVVFVVLARQYQDLDVRRQRQQFVDQPESLVGPMRCRRQPKIDERELGRGFQLTQQALHLGSRLGHVDVEVSPEHEVEGIRDQRVVVDDEQIGFVRCGSVHVLSRGPPWEQIILPDRPAWS